MWESFFSEQKIEYATINLNNGGSWQRLETSNPYPSYTTVSYTLVKTEPEPVPEPLTAGGTALALAGLSWLKHKKKMAG